MLPVRVGTAGWTIPRSQADALPGPGSHLERYGRTLNCAEINSSFYRPSRESTWLRWAASVPSGFQFAVKAPKAISHEAALELTLQCKDALTGFLDQTRLLGPKLGPLLFQLPPKQQFDPRRARAFFDFLRTLHDGPITLEPRHPSWFCPESDSLLRDLFVARAASDPTVVPEAAVPGGASSLLYWRLHGSPRKYYSPYSVEYLNDLARTVRNCPAGTEAWIVFDNTASGAALGNALELLSALRDT